MESFYAISEMLNKAGIKPSLQRVKILGFLDECQCHPTAEYIFNGLREKNLNISRATVYNTLKLFVEKGIVNVLSMEGNESRYDILTHGHGHFVCEKCGSIFDFEINEDYAVKSLLGELEGCRIHQKEIYFKGICPECF